MGASGGACKRERFGPFGLEGALISPAGANWALKMAQPPTLAGRGLLCVGWWIQAARPVWSGALPLTNTLAVPLAVTVPEVMAP